jgi:hypothetical protein
MSNDLVIMPGKLKAAWLEALSSGRYKQTDGQLRDGDGFCCLGVLCDVVHPGCLDEQGNTPLEQGESLLPARIQEYSGLTRDVQLKLANMNDGGGEWYRAGMSFQKIANWIERNIHPVEPGIGFAVFRAETLTALDVSEKNNG